MERKKEETNYNSLEALSICASLLITFGLIGWGFNITLPFAPEERAKWQSKVIGYSLWQIQINKETRQNSVLAAVAYGRDRSIASVPVNDEIKGSIGRDPWGQAYQYAIKNEKQLLYIWSKGPDLKDDSRNEQIGFQGDDIGYIIDLKMKH